MGASPAVQYPIRPLIIPPNCVINIGLIGKTPGCTDLSHNSCSATLIDRPVPQNMLINSTSKVESGILHGALRKHRYTMVIGDVVDKAMELEDIRYVVSVSDVDFKCTRLCHLVYDQLSHYPPCKRQTVVAIVGTKIKDPGVDEIHQIIAVGGLIVALEALVVSIP
mmetsp:Transcript_8098/g.19133  ORF Transcript_8098/g.19133 Transcript_8098/m.19133 type:complete len:166 (+) Transcript_8098:682-1179(+)